jgi:hypothetical protein
MGTGCGSSGEPSGAGITILLTVYDAEWEADKILLGVGDYATVQVEPSIECPSEVPCWSAEDSLVVRSSNPDIFSVTEQLRLMGPTRVWLIGHAPGTAVLTATLDGHTESRQITVASEPPPADSLHVEVVTEWADLPAQYDPSHNLTWVEVPGGDYYPFLVRAFRGGKEIFGHPSHVTPTISPGSVTEVTSGCRPTRADIHCLIIHDFWIRGINSGDAQLTVWGRYTCGTADPAPCLFPSTRFTVHVP